MPLIQLEEKQNIIHWFSPNEKDFRVTPEDKTSFWVPPKIPTPWLFWETQRGLILCLSCCQMRRAILHLYLFPTAFEQFFTGKINGLFSFRQFKVAWRISMEFAEIMSSMCWGNEQFVQMSWVSLCGVFSKLWLWTNWCRSHILQSLPAKVKVTNHLRVQCKQRAV